MTDKVGEMILEQLFKIQEELKDCVKKDDLKNFATKDDLKNFATKDDLKNFATKDDLKALEEKMDTKFATKDDLKAMEERMNAKFATKDDLKGLEKRIDKKMKARFAQQSQEIANQFHMAFESAERIHRQMEARIDAKNDMKIAQALQMQA